MPDPRTDAEKLLHDEAGHPTPLYRSYLTYQRNFHAALERRDHARAQALLDVAAAAMLPMVGAQLQRDIDAAYDQWSALGHKTQVERAVALIGAAGAPPTPPPTASTTF